MIPEYHIYLGADHRGFEKKEALFPILNECHENVIVEDLGAENYDADDDFNDPATAVARAVANDEHSFGVLICGSAHGVCMQANRFNGVRAINASTEESAKLGREEDYANVVCLAGDKLDVDKMEKIIKVFCHTRPLLEEKYARRVRRLDEMDQAPEKFKTAMATDGTEESSEEE